MTVSFISWFQHSRSFVVCISKCVTGIWIYRMWGAILCNSFILPFLMLSLSIALPVWNVDYLQKGLDFGALAISWCPCVQNVPSHAPVEEKTSQIALLDALPVEKKSDKVASRVPFKCRKCDEVPSLHYEYVVTFCTPVPLVILTAPAPKTSWVRHWFDI